MCTGISCATATCGQSSKLASASESVVTVSSLASNPYFYSASDQVNRFPCENGQKKDQQIVKTKLTKSRVANSFTSVLSCRLREGSTIRSVSIYPSSA